MQGNQMKGTVGGYADIRITRTERSLQALDNGGMRLRKDNTPRGQDEDTRLARKRRKALKAEASRRYDRFEA
jgi:hypothetical protein